MLKQEDADKLLKQEQVKTWQDHAIVDIAGLSPYSRTIAFALLGRDESGNPLPQRSDEDRTRFYAILNQAVAQLAALESSPRLALFTALMPGIATHIEAAWQLHSRLPYQTNHAFRLRQSGNILRDSPWSWFHGMLHGLGAYRRKDITWVAAWAPYLSSYYLAQPLGILLAAAIDAGGVEGDAVFEILTASARGEHPIGAMGRHVTTALLVTSRPDGWDFVERLLLAAQREEGLRQVILETVHEAHPDAFRRMLRLILDEDLIRFSATIRAANVWLGFGWDIDTARSAHTILTELLDLLTNQMLRNQILAPRLGPKPDGVGVSAPLVTTRSAQGKAGDQEATAILAAQHIYLALWAVAFDDAEGAIDAASPALHDPDPLRRLAAAYLVRQLSLPAANAALVPLLDDPDLRVALCAFAAVQGSSPDRNPGLFERFQTLLARLDAKIPSLESGLWPWLSLNARPEAVADELVRHLGSRHPTCLIPFLPSMSTRGQTDTVWLLAALPEWDSQILETFFTLVASRSSDLRGRVLAQLATRPITPEIALPLEGLLSRKTSEARRAILTVLLKQPDDGAFASGERLLAARTPLQRLAGLDLLRELAQAGRAIPRCLATVETYQSTRQSLSPDEQTMITAIRDTGIPAQIAPTLANVLGLINPAACSQLVPPRHLHLVVATPAARACLEMLDELVEQHRTTVVLVKAWSGSEHLFGNLYHLPQPDLSLTPAEDAANLPLAEVWLEWERTRPAGTRDVDGLELYRALLLLSGSRVVHEPGIQTWLRKTRYAVARLFHMPGERDGEDQEVDNDVRATIHQKELRHEIVSNLLEWLVRLQEPLPPGTTDFLLDAVETSLALIPRRELENLAAAQATKEWYNHPDPRADGSLQVLRQYLAWRPDAWTPGQQIRHWRLLHWLDQPVAGISRQLPPLEVVLRAHHAGGANEADILEHLVAPTTAQHVDHLYGLYGHLSGHDLSLLTTRKPHPFLVQYPILQRLVPALRERILDVELARGEMPTPATALALSLRHAGGTTLFVKLLAALASSDLVRGYRSDMASRASVFSYLLRTTYPAPDDTYEVFANLIFAAHIDDRRLIAAAVYAPQWARHVEHTLGWPQLEDAIWWTHAHTKDISWTVDQALRDTWNAQVSERTPLRGQDLMDGAVDVAWFWRSYRPLGADRWEQIYAAAKYASNGAGHARARLFADAMLGKITAADLQQRIASSRHQDAVRALGLLPLPAGPSTARETQVTVRYQAIQEFLRTSKQFGAQRRASEELATRIGLENLSRTAGYADPIRLQWAMEANLSADLRDGSLCVEADSVLVTLSLNPITAEPELTISKNGSLLKSVPAKLKKNEAIVALQERKREIERQISRMRIALEGAMCRGDRFTASEIAGLLDHPVLAPLLRNLIFVHDDPKSTEPFQVLGYPVLAPDQHPTAPDPHPPILNQHASALDHHGSNPAFAATPGTIMAPAEAVQHQPASPAAPLLPPPAVPVLPQQAPAGWRTFAFKDDKSDKFWRILLDGASFKVNYGRTGTDGQHQQKQFPTEPAAAREAGTLIREKMAKGYVEITSPPVTSPSLAITELTPDLPAAPAIPARAHEEPAGDDRRPQQSHRGARALQFRTHDGSLQAVESNEPILRLAHPHDLFASGEWHAWQHDCFANERIQPFKQVFRELYVPTQNELRTGDDVTSSRYTGHQVQPHQALALFGQRGWVSSYGEGVSRTFHQEGFTAWVAFDGGFGTPAEVEGLTIDHLYFSKPTDWGPVPLKEVPPRIFSEVMRDLDLVVSVAHRGGVDPEATASTVEMRAALVRETCALLRISNVSIKSAHTLIEGALGNYSVHLGSAVVHRQPGGALCIVPVHSQHRGRLFLPFADDDPRTAEVISKVVLLARDTEIKDPSILEQIL
jgi:predicted DNA-binding WGR domain protein